MGAGLWTCSLQGRGPSTALPAGVTDGLRRPFNPSGGGAGAAGMHGREARSWLVVNCPQLPRFTEWDPSLTPGED